MGEERTGGGGETKKLVITSKYQKNKKAPYLYLTKLIAIAPTPGL